MVLPRAKRRVVDAMKFSDFMVMLSATEALITLLNIMAVPAVLLIVFGGLTWYKASSYQMESRVKYGKLMLMFGIILLVIVLITSYYLSQMLIRQQVSIR